MTTPAPDTLEREKDKLLARLDALFDFNPETGFFIRKHASGGAKAGDIAGHVNKDGYRYIRIDGKRYLAHRLAWLCVYGEWPPSDLDHEDGNGDHNWIKNLRPATDSQNMANQRKHKDNIGYKGAYRTGTRWIAKIKKDGVVRRLGRFDTPEEAHAAYCAAARELFGEFARTE